MSSMPNFSSAIARNKERIETYLEEDIPGLDEALERYHTNYFIAQMSDSNRIMFQEQADARKWLVEYIAKYVGFDRANGIPI